MPPKEPKPPADALEPSAAVAEAGEPTAPAVVAEPATPAPEKPKPVVKTPAEWATELGHIKPANPLIPQSTETKLPALAVAERLYGWAQHAYDYQLPEKAFVLTRAAYLSAIEAAPQHPAVGLVVEALTPAAAEALRDFKPARNLKLERAAAEAEAKLQAQAAAKAAEAKTETA